MVSMSDKVVELILPGLIISSAVEGSRRLRQYMIFLTQLTSWLYIKEENVVLSSPEKYILNNFYRKLFSFLRSLFCLKLVLGYRHHKLSGVKFPKWLNQDLSRFKVRKGINLIILVTSSYTTTK